MKTQWEQYVNAYCPNPNDNPGSHGWYARYSAFQKLIVSLEGGIEQQATWDRIIHQSVSWYGMDGTFGQILGAMEKSIPDIPKKPEMPFHYDSVPAFDAEKEAKKVFRDEFKKMFPGKRVNSRFGRGMWAVNQKRTIEVVTERHDKLMMELDGRERERDRKHDEKIAEWKSACANVERIREVYEKLKSE